MPCINVLSPFRSPWARKKEDEEYLSRTLSRLGEIVRDDVKLGTVYLTLVLATPPSEATEETKASKCFQKYFQFWFLFPVQPLAAGCTAGGGAPALPVSFQQIPGHTGGSAALQRPQGSHLRPGSLQQDQRVREAGEPGSSWVVAPGHKSIITKTLRH